MRISDWSSDVCSSDLLGKTLGADRRHFDWLAVDLVAGADADHVEIIEHVELGHAQAGDAVVEDRATRGNRIEHAKATTTLGDGAVLGHLGTDVPDDFDDEFGREWHGKWKKGRVREV